MQPNETANPQINWFAQGAIAGVLVTGTLNALSYFVRSGGWGSLLGGPAAESIGFPLRLWSGDGYHFSAISTRGVLGNVVFAIGLSLLCGLALRQFAVPLNRLIDKMSSEVEESHQFQFSLRALLMFTLGGGVVSAVVRTLALSPRVLAGIYLFGPLCLVLIAMIPRGIRWQQRIAIVMPGALIMIVVAVIVGLALQIAFDKVLLGIFTCWTPQSALAAIAITAAVLFYRRHDMMAEQTR